MFFTVIHLLQRCDVVYKVERIEMLGFIIYTIVNCDARKFASLLQSAILITNFALEVLSVSVLNSLGNNMAGRRGWKGFCLFSNLTT